MFEKGVDEGAPKGNVIIHPSGFRISDWKVSLGSTHKDVSVPDIKISMSCSFDKELAVQGRGFVTVTREQVSGGGSVTVVRYPFEIVVNDTDHLVIRAYAQTGIQRISRKV